MNELRLLCLRGLRGKVLAGIAAAGLVVMGAAACGTSQASPRPAVPAEFRAACGHPGAEVTVRKVPVTVSHAACDLTGVMITVPGHGGTGVPRGGTGIGNSMGLSVTVDPGTLDVTVEVTGPAGNA